MKPNKKAIAIITEPIDHNDHYYFVVPDNSAGTKERYTIYRIPSSPSRNVKVVGRELPLEFSLEHIKKLQKETQKSNRAQNKVKNEYRS